MLTINEETILAAFYEAAGKFSGFRFGDVKPHVILTEIKSKINSPETICNNTMIKSIEKYKTKKKIEGANSGINLIIDRIKNSENPTSWF